MKKSAEPFDFRKFFQLLGLMGAMLVVTLLAIAIMLGLYAWVGSWGVAAFLLVLFVASRLIVRHYVPRMLAHQTQAEVSKVEQEESQIQDGRVDNV